MEEITGTYVVMKLWDERRLVLPTSYFTTTPFQNWTRTESRVLGEVARELVAERGLELGDAALERAAALVGGGLRVCGDVPLRARHDGDGGGGTVR